MTVEIWLPPSARPAYQCNICGETFTRDEESAWLRHLRKCLRRNRDDLEAASHAFHDDPMQRAHDPEAEDFLRRSVGKR